MRLYISFSNNLLNIERVEIGPWTDFPGGLGGGGGGVQTIPGSGKHPPRKC